MKRIVQLIMVIAATHFAAYAQNSSAVLFTENGEPFQVVLNGVIQNTAPSTNVKLTSLNAPNYKMKIIFADRNLGEIDKNLFLQPDAENTFNIKRKQDGEWVVRILSVTPTAELPPPINNTNQNVVVYSPNPPVNTTTRVYENTTIPPVETTTTTTTTTYTDPLPVGDNVNINMGLGGMGINMNVNGGGMGTTTQQTTTTYSTTTTNGGGQYYQQQQQVYSQPNTTTVIVQDPPPPPPQPNVYVMPGYSGPVGCPYPMSQQDFSNIKASIVSKSFESTKLEIAKQVLGSRCMLSAQVKELMSVFDFEASKLDISKFAYGRTYDIGNYYMVNDAFGFESSISDLNNYINGYRR